MRWLLVTLFVLILIVQYSLWFGKSGWGRVNELEVKLNAQKETNQALLARNNAMLAEVEDLKSGTQAVEERARNDLGMLRDDEIYIQILPTE